MKTSLKPPALVVVMAFTGRVGQSWAADGTAAGSAASTPASMAMDRRNVEIRIRLLFGSFPAWEGYDLSSSFTLALALAKSSRPAKRSFSAAITRPMSFIPWALISRTRAAMAAPASRSDIGLGR